MSILSIDHSQVSQASADLINLLGSDLNFHDSKKKNISHNFHSFPAKFPPELPRKFIDSLTLPGDIVLDPMNGSGTTTLEAFLSNRKALGFDIDPLAIKIA
jgi:DNA modification methylase